MGSRMLLRDDRHGGVFSDLWLRPSTRVDHLMREGVADGGTVVVLDFDSLNTLMMAAAFRPQPAFDHVEDEEMRARLVEGAKKDHAAATETVQVALMTPWQAHPEHLRAMLALVIDEARRFVADVEEGREHDSRELLEVAEEAELLAAWYGPSTAESAGELFSPPRRPSGPPEVVDALLEAAKKAEQRAEQEEAGDAIG